MIGDVLNEADLCFRMKRFVKPLSVVRCAHRRSSCQRFSVALCLFAIIYPTIANSKCSNTHRYPSLTYMITTWTAYMTLRHYALWDQRKKAVMMVFIVLTLTYTPMVILATMTIFVYYSGFPSYFVIHTSSSDFGQRTPSMCMILGHAS